MMPHRRGMRPLSHETSPLIPKGQPLDQLSQPGRLRISLRTLHGRAWWPSNRHVRIVVGEPGLGSRIVIARRFVYDVGDIREHAESMREAIWAE